MANQCIEFGRYLGTVVIADAAKREGALISWHGGRMVVAEVDGKRMLAAGPAGTESALSESIATDKLLTKRLLDEAGVATPSGRLVDSGEDTVLAQREIGKPIVVKPRFGVMGRGVTVNIEDEDDLRSAYQRAHGSSRDVIVEEYIHGAEYRGHGSASECVAVFQRLLPSVTGNGRDTVADLVASKNRIRKLNPNTMTNPIILDTVADGFLARQGLSQDSVVPEGANIIVRDVNGITSGGDSRECLDDSSESVREATSRAIAAIPGMSWGGTDIIVSDETAQAFVMEVNTYASISGPIFPVYGKPRATANEVWRRIKERALTEVARADAAVESHYQPFNVCELVSHGSSVDLVLLLREKMENREYEVNAVNQSIYTASRGNERLWFAGCRTAADLLRPHRVLNRQVSLRRILRGGGVPQVSGRRVTDVAQLKSFVQRHDEMTLMIRSSGRFEDKDVRLLPAQARASEIAMAGRRSWFVQEYPVGRRYTVVASRSGVLAIIARRSADTCSERELQRVAERAVDAVRAVPELRWSAVQLVIPQIRAEGHALVEGMTINPVFSPGDYLVAGSFEDFTDLVLEGARHGV